MNITPFSPVDVLSSTLNACFHVGPEVGSVCWSNVCNILKFEFTVFNVLRSCDHVSIVLFEQAVIVFDAFPVEIHNLEVINKPETMRDCSTKIFPNIYTSLSYHKVYT